MASFSDAGGASYKDGLVAPVKDTRVKTEVSFVVLHDLKSQDLVIWLLRRVDLFATYS